MTFPELSTLKPERSDNFQTKLPTNNVQMRFSVKKTPLFRTFLRPITLTLSGVALLLALPTAADQSIPDEPPETPLKFITIDVAPWASNNPETGQKEGAFVAIVDALSELTGLTIETTLTPFARVDRELEAGTHDCTILVPRDESIVIHGELVADHDVGILSHKDNPIDDYADLQGTTISLLRGSAISPEFDQDEAINKVYDTDYLIALRKLDRQRVAGVAGAIPTLKFLANQNGLGDMLAPALKLTDIPLVFQCSRQSTQLALMPSLNAAIETLKQSGRLEEITDLYHF